MTLKPSSPSNCSAHLLELLVQFGAVQLVCSGKTPCMDLVLKRTLGHVLLHCGWAPEVSVCPATPVCPTCLCDITVTLGSRKPLATWATVFGRKLHSGCAHAVHQDIVKTQSRIWERFMFFPGSDKTRHSQQDSRLRRQTSLLLSGPTSSPSSLTKTFWLYSVLLWLK